MKVLLYMAPTINGLIAKSDGDSNWVSETEAKSFQEKVSEIGCIVVGRKTYEQYFGELYPMKDVLNIVLSSKQKTSDLESVIFVQSPAEAIQAAEAGGKETLMLVGGGTINGAFMNEGLIDEIFLDIEPIVFGTGIKLFGDADFEAKLELLGTKLLSPNELQLHYKVVR